jgi:hypothetical protein
MFLPHRLLRKIVAWILKRHDRRRKTEEWSVAAFPRRHYTIYSTDLGVTIFARLYEKAACMPVSDC